MMKKTITLLLLTACLLTTAHAGMIVYTYDENHRLTGVNYSDEALITYDYDDAGNMTDHSVLTDAKYLKPFLLYFTMRHPARALRLAAAHRDHPAQSAI